MSSPRVIRWGIFATGAIAKTFAKDLLVDPATRNVHSLRHVVAAVASSSSAARASDFAKEINAPDARVYGSYQELVDDKDLDVIYIATPHSHHYQHIRLCLEAGHNVLCEKAITVNALQLRSLAALAREKNLFLMEALWTRYFPLTIHVLETIQSGRIGTVQRVLSDLSAPMNPEESFKDGKHRMVNPDLAGGALLDLGIYSLIWPFLAFYLAEPAESRKKPEVFSLMNKYAPTLGADETTTMILRFPRASSAGGDGHAVATTSFRVAGIQGPDPSPPPVVRIQGSLGEVQIFPGAHRPSRTRIIFGNGTVEDKDWPQPGPGKGSGWFNGFLTHMNAEGEGMGMAWEADEVGFALIEGRKEGKFSPIQESIAILEVMDEVRRQGGLQYPDAVETIRYPLSN
ncbi:hypothetical protein LCI18_003683 [Fusarium solani-melongenae]|uniref:Uncharacterized protein n=1 Tax=Fusarium solani subsp. cucurbitae TaxID=2747967 RepID=A0ACD3YY13_FUSSC|nr:hypothetical protein LCI18_003683 [Fusarium solani-melongenae]